MKDVRAIPSQEVKNSTTKKGVSNSLKNITRSYLKRYRKEYLNWLRFGIVSFIIPVLDIFWLGSGKRLLLRRILSGLMMGAVRFSTGFDSLVAICKQSIV